MFKRGKIGKVGIFASLMMAFVLVFSLAACGDTGENGDALTLDKSTATVNVESTTTITVTSSTTESIVWTVDKPEIATVTGSGTGNKLGLVTGVAEGTAVVTATAGDKSATCTVTVSNSAQNAETVTIKLDGEEVGSDVLTMHVDDELTFTATASKNGTISWESSDSAIATVANGKVTAISAGDVTITAKVSDSSKATVKITVYAPTEVVNGGESEFTTGWRYWTGGGTVISCVNYGPESVIIEYNLASDANWYAIQLFYKDRLAIKDHDVTLTVNSSVEGDITVNNVAKHLVAGENTITVENYICTDQNYNYAATLSIQFGISEGSKPLVDENGENVKITISNITYTSNANAELKVPDFTFNTETKVVTINDTLNGAISDKSYKIGLFDSATAVEPAYVFTVANGDELSLNAVKTGNYVVRLQVVSSDNYILNSDWSENNVPFTWSNEKTPLGTATETDAWYYWADEWSTVNNAGNGEAYVDATGIHLYVTTNNSWTYGVQLKYNSSRGISHVKMTIRAQTLRDTGGAVGLNLSDENYVLVQVAGQTYYETTIDVDVTGTNLILCLGANQNGASQTDVTQNLRGEILIYNIQFTYAN